MLTPNIPEAQRLTGIKIASLQDQMAAARALAERTGVKKTLDERRRNFERIRNLAICAISSINAVCLR